MSGEGEFEARRNIGTVKEDQKEEVGAEHVKKNLGEQEGEGGEGGTTLQQYAKGLYFVQK